VAAEVTRDRNQKTESAEKEGGKRFWVYEINEDIRLMAPAAFWFLALSRVRRGIIKGEIPLYARGTPNSAGRPRIMLTNCVRCLTSRSRVRCIDSAACCWGDFTGTNRIVDHATASQTASESAASVLPRLTYGLT
jgi:hypothetical protein